MGNLVKNYPVPIVIKTIWFKKSSGELSIKGPGFSKRLYFIRGRLEYAASELPQERLGAMLHAKNVITEEHLRLLEDLRRESQDEKIGRILVKNGILTQKELYFYLAYQSKMIAASAFGLMEGEWEFRKGMPALAAGQRFAIPLFQVIIEGVQRISNLALYKSLLSMYPLHVAKLPKSLAFILTPFDLRFYRSLAGFSGEMVEAIRKKMGAVGDAFWKKVLMLYLLNVLDFNEAAPFLASETETIIIQSGMLLRKR